MFDLMKRIVFMGLLLVMSACQPTDVCRRNAIDQLARMAERDQGIQMDHLSGESNRVRDSLYQLQDRIFRAHTDTLKRLFEQYGFVDARRFGKEASRHFWLLVQHADHDPAFQKEVLFTMGKAVARGLADPGQYAYLSDRVQVNAGEKQQYGTQLEYREDFWIVPKPTRDSITLNQRRLAIGLPAIEAYLNQAMQRHYDMNRSVYQQRGLNGPWQYPE